MLALELTQMAQQVGAVDAAMADADDPASPARARQRYLEAALEEGKPSPPLRIFLEKALRRQTAP